MDTTVKGIVLKTKEYKDNDKLLTILSLEKGKILVKARGVKKASSKLKPYCQSFCFAEFELVSSKAGYILTGVNEIESFYDMTCDIDKFSHAFCVLELVDKVCYENQDYTSIFIDTLKCLKQMKANSSDIKLTLCKFIFNVLNFEGFNINLDKCVICNKTLTKNIFFNISKGEISCENCKSLDDEILDNAIFSALKIISNNTYEQLKTVKFSNTLQDKLLKFLTQNVYFRYEIKLKSLIL